jgi:hypothetical protein
MDSLISFILSSQLALAVDSGSAFPLAMIVAFSNPIGCGQDGTERSKYRGRFAGLIYAFTLLVLLVVFAV